jgi:hypothetical protein
VTDKKKGALTPPGGLPLLSRIGQRMVYGLLHLAVPPSEEVLQAVPRDVRRTYEFMREAELLRKAAPHEKPLPELSNTQRRTFARILAADSAFHEKYGHPPKNELAALTKPRISVRTLSEPHYAAHLTAARLKRSPRG